MANTRDLKNDDTIDAGFDLLLDQITIGAATGDAGVTKLVIGATNNYDGMISEAYPMPVEEKYQSPNSEHLASVALAAGASVNLDFSNFPASKTGKLLKVTCSSTLAGKFVISTRDGAVVVNKATIFTSGIGESPSFIFEPVSKNSIILAYGDGDENFRVSVTNLDDSLAADFYVTCEWDEV